MRTQSSGSTDLAGPVSNSSFAPEETEDGLQLRHQASGTVHSLNDTAASVWWLADGTRSRDEIAGLLAQLFHTDVETVGDDVDSALSDMTRLGIINNW